MELLSECRVTNAVNQIDFCCGEIFGSTAQHLTEQISLFDASWKPTHVLIIEKNSLSKKNLLDLRIS